jgi:hypothetical protein
LVMPHGNYNIIAFAQTLSQVLTSGSTHGFIYNVTSDVGRALTMPITGKYTYTIQANDSLLPVSIEVGLTLFEQFGFERESVNTFDENNSLISPNVVNMNRESTLYLHSSMCQNETDNILHEIYTTGTEAGAYITYENKIPTETAKSFTFNHGNPWFRLTNEDDEIINLNGINLNFTLLLSK